MTLADDDTNSILTDNADRTFQGNVAVRVTQHGGLLWKQRKWRHLVAIFGNYTSGALAAKFADVMQMVPYRSQLCN